MSLEQNDPAVGPGSSRLAPRVPSWAEGAVGERVPCAQHPRVETYLRCRSCGRAICPSCAVATPQGARCPRCAEAAGRLRSGVASSAGLLWVARVLGGALAGLAVAMGGGAMLTFVPFGALRVLPLVVLGYLVGEVSAAIARRPGGALLALLAFGSALMGPLAGEAMVGNVLGGQLPGAVSLSGSAVSLGPFGALVLMAGAALAAIRAATADG